MTKKKEKTEPVQHTETEVQTEVVVETVVAETSKEEPVKKEQQVEPVKKKETKPSISDIEVAKKLVNIHSSAQNRSLEFNLTFECVKKLLEYTTCYYTNVQFTEDGPNARSFDRVDNEKGYVVGNVVACTVDINGKKNNLSIDEIVCLYKKLAYLKK
jgi:hypothetical protein